MAAQAHTIVHNVQGPRGRGGLPARVSLDVFCCKVFMAGCSPVVFPQSVLTRVSWEVVACGGTLKQRGSLSQDMSVCQRQGQLFQFTTVGLNAKLAQAFDGLMG